MQTVDRYALRLVRIPPATALGLSYQNLKPYLLRSKPSIPNIIPSLFMMKHLSHITDLIGNIMSRKLLYQLLSENKYRDSYTTTFM